MKALTLHRPWSHAIAHLGKTVENRSWRLPAFMLGQRCAIHASKTNDRQAHAGLVAEGFALPVEVPASVIVSTVRFIGCVEGDGTSYDVISVARGVDPARVKSLAIARDYTWIIGPYGWVMDEVRTFAELVACKGAQGFWSVPPLVELAVAREEARCALARLP